MRFLTVSDPISQKRFRRFKSVKRAWFSLWILGILYLASLGAELICNDMPLYARFQGKSYFPVFRFYPEDEFLKNERRTRPNYKAIHQTPVFTEDAENFMIFAPVPFGPYESIDPKSIPMSDQVTLRFTVQPKIAAADIGPEYIVFRFTGPDILSGRGAQALQQTALSDLIRISPSLEKAVGLRFSNQSAPAFREATQTIDGRPIQIRLSTFSPRAAPPKTVRLTFREAGFGDAPEVRVVFSRDLEPVQDPDKIWSRIAEPERAILREFVDQRFSGSVAPYALSMDGAEYGISFEKSDVRFPYPPVSGHWMGIDAAGRDVLARVLYGLRTSMSFGLLLVFGSMALGVFAGAVQGYYGGAVDIGGQRLIEIWSALPFLYIMILMGSVYGRSFVLLLICYGLFNWIGISYYIRAEFLRLRSQAFVEAARCMGLSSYRIIAKHILPNALVPVITLFPFSLVGAIGSLAALDYLGFGLPPPTASWGELLFQAQQYRWAWWLILYPSAALFGVMLLGVFVGEGIRNAYDPKQYSRLE